MSEACQRPGNKIQKSNGWSARKVASRQGKKLPEWSASKIGLLAGLLVVVCAMVSAVHWPVLSSPVNFFDDGYFNENPLVQNPSWASARRFLTEVLKPSTVKGYYHPLPMLSLMVDYALGGREDNLRPVHRTSLAFHAANTALVIVLLYLLFGRVWIASGIGLLFGLHPMSVESIAWIGERKTLLTAFFALWSLILYVHYARKTNRGLYVGSLLMYVLALMSKPSSLPLPALMILTDYWPLKRLKLRTVLEKLPFFVIGGIFAIITYLSESGTAGVKVPTGYGPERIPLIICHNIIFYLYKIIWPANLLSSGYPFPHPLGLSDPMILAGVIGTCILIPMLVVSLRWTRAALTGWLFFFVAILPTIQIVRFTDAIASDKYAYLPSVGLLLVLASLLSWFCGAGKPAVRQAAVVMVVLVLAGAEAVATRRYLVHWRDTVSHYEHMLTVTPDAPSMHFTLGTILQSQGRLDEAVSHYRQALQAENDYIVTISHNSLGITLALQRRLDEAVSHFRQALRIEPDFANAHYNLGKVLQSQGKVDEAISHYSQAIRTAPHFAEAHNNLGIALVTSGKFGEALEHFGEAVRLVPDYLAPLNSMAWILATNPAPELRDAAGAIGLAKRAAKLTEYQDAAILDTLAAAYAAAGQFDQAVMTAQTAFDLASAARAYGLANEIRNRLGLYRQRRPYWEPVRLQNAIRP